MKKIIAVGLSLLLFGDSCWALDAGQNEILKEATLARERRKRDKSQQASNAPQPAASQAPVAGPFGGVQTFAGSAAAEHAKRAARARNAASGGKSGVPGGGVRTLADIAADSAAAAPATEYSAPLGTAVSAADIQGLFDVLLADPGRSAQLLGDEVSPPQSAAKVPFFHRPASLLNAHKLGALLAAAGLGAVLHRWLALPSRQPILDAVQSLSAGHPLKDLAFEEDDAAFAEQLKHLQVNYAEELSDELKLAITNYLENKRSRIGGVAAYSALAAGLWLLFRAQGRSQFRLQKKRNQGEVVLQVDTDKFPGQGWKVGSRSSARSSFGRKIDKWLYS